MLLVGHTESLMPLPAQFAVVSDEVKALRADYASLARKTTRVKKKLDTYEVNQAEATSSKTQSHDQSQVSMPVDFLDRVTFQTTPYRRTLVISRRPNVDWMHSSRT